MNILSYSFSIIKGKQNIYKSLKSKGALFIEYALILAFVITVGVLFVSDGAMKNNIAGIFDQAADMMRLANGEKKYTSYSVQIQTGWSCTSKGVFTDSTSDTWGKFTNRTNELIPLGGPGTYQFTINYENMKDYLAQEGISVTEQNIKDYFNSTNIGYFCLKADGTLSENHFQRYTEDGGGTLTNTNINIKPDSTGWNGNSGEIRLSSYFSGKDKYYQIVTTEQDGNTSLRYNICHGSKTNAVKYQKYDEALINAGMTINKVE